MPWLLFKRDVLLALRRGGGTFATLSFCIIVFCLFAFSLGPEALAVQAPRILAVTVLLSCLLALPGLFERDHDDGTLEQYVLRPLALEWLVLAKLASFWLTSALPLVLLAPLLGMAAGMNAVALGSLTVALLLATPTLVAIGAIGAALTLGLRKSGLTQALILLPLYVPVLIFTAGAGEADAPLMLLAALLLASLPLSGMVSAGLLRIMTE
jgi:heme exporter protein B